MNYDVRINPLAEKDLDEIYENILLNDCKINAEKLIDKLIQKCLDLKKFPNRGHKLQELEYMEKKDYLEIHYKPYRIIYKIINRIVFIYCILDGRRDLKDLLNKRLLR
ncbi:MAG: type II toxin-antitoxin system RelE/ParE family toxin [Ignavibacteria bacterium]|nr:type II toxin-antitoxin system RelE/ParE family toxin [Ignavibacteria bacterium]